MRQAILHLTALSIVTLIAGCSSVPDVVPENLESQIDKNVTFNQVLADPDAYRGKTVIFGGEVLKARGLKDGTQLEVLQLPLEHSQRPLPQRTGSQGRFLALNREFLDPATFADGTPVTIVGEVTGSIVQRLDETEYRYPALAIKHLHVWEDADDPERSVSRPWFGVFGGVGVGGGRSGGGGGVSIGTGF